MKDTQHKSTELSVGQQLTLLSQRPERKEPDLAYLASLPNFRRVLRYSVSLADLESKQVYDPLGKDKATWSRYESGDAPFPAELILPLRAITNNDAPLLWLNYQAGFDLTTLRPRESDTERQLREAREEAAELRRTLKHVLEARK